MGLKDELVVLNDPDESSGDSQTSADTGADSPAEESEPSLESEASESEDEATESESPEAEASELPSGEEASDSVTIETAEEEEEDEEDLEDPQDVLKESCMQKAECQALQEELDRCNERVSGKSNTTEDCAQELYDFVHCVDHCVAHTLFTKLK